MTGLPDDGAGSDQPAAPSLRIGLAVLYVADGRLAQATLDSLARMTSGPDRTLLIEQSIEPRQLASLRFDGALERAEAPSWVNARALAIETLSDCDIVMIVKEGVVLGPNVAVAERDRFATDRSLQATLATSTLMLDIDGFLAAKDRSDPFALLQASGAKPTFCSSYFSPCILSVAPKRGLRGEFERYARRSEWAAARFFLDRSDAIVKFEYATNAFGAVRNVPDRRGSERHGFEIYSELSLFREAFPAYERFARREIRTIALDQLAQISRLSMPKHRFAFLKGMSVAAKRRRETLRRVQRDIRNMA